MFKTFVTLLRGAAAGAEEEIADRNALLLLDQQIRDAAGAVGRGKRALAGAVVNDNRERKRIDALSARITDLEERAVAALTAGRDDLAAEAAEAIAAMENDRDAAVEARASYAEEIAHLRAAVLDCTRRLTELDRGRHIARAAEAARRLDGGSYSPSLVAVGALAEAEATLRRLRDRQAEDAAVDRVVESLDAEVDQATLVARLEAAGCGVHTRMTAADVLARIGNRTKRIAVDAD